MDLITLDDLRILAEKREEYCVSLYMPMQRMAKETRQNPILLKNLIGKAEEELIALGMRRPEAGGFLKKARSYLGEGPFWQHQSDGLAMFITRDDTRAFRVPVPFTDLVVVTDRFHLKPMLALFTGDGRYYVLALSQNEARLFHCTRYSAHEVRVDGMPRGLADALKYDVLEKHLQFHTRTPAIQGGGRAFSSGAKEGKRPAIFHGHGSGTDDEKDRIMQYFLQVDRILQKVLYRDQAPLVLAGVEYLFSIYRAANSYQYLLDDGVGGNPEILKPEELRQQAWAVVAPHFSETQAKAGERFMQELGTGHASKDIKEILRGASQGRVDTLRLWLGGRWECKFVPVGLQVWGVFTNGGVHVHEKEEPGDEDLLDVAAIQTVLNGGTVYAVKPEEVPGGSPLAAIFRY
ncbi:MAG: hypothetical protein C4520_05215 [Candidatus Abyssobacteria bacterium SURF_5]|uniref:Uncharacterized protein n=1 Tax=Abyssobacteria bacterium (strain SURF_5) TaxID=2093360 RepID=A0A3A4P7Q4_ABYX5|nr:MAG: hypothetical protein C4520_05215 [Candidatus Abyssubacteria bacterium SURF_5]